VPRSQRVSSRVKALPWAGLLRAGMVLGKRWSALSDKERARLRSLIRSSRGRLGNLSLRERHQLRQLVRKLDIRGAGRELLPLLGGGRRRRRRR